jgi:hypothetical protein
MKVGGFIQGNSTIISQPKFEDKHIQFFEKKGYDIVKAHGYVIIKRNRVSSKKIEELIHAYEYDYGPW